MRSFAASISFSLSLCSVLLCSLHIVWIFLKLSVNWILWIFFSLLLDYIFRSSLCLRRENLSFALSQHLDRGLSSHSLLNRCRTPFHCCIFIYTHLKRKPSAHILQSYNTKQHTAPNRIKSLFDFNNVICHNFLTFNSSSVAISWSCLVCIYVWCSMKPMIQSNEKKAAHTHTHTAIQAQAVTQTKEQ